MSRAAARRQAKDRSTRSLVLRITLLSFIILLAAVVFVIFLQQQNEFDRLAKKKVRLEAERDRLAGVNADLVQLDSLTGTDIYWERLARDQLGMVRPDDIVIRFD